MSINDATPEEWNDLSRKGKTMEEIWDLPPDDGKTPPKTMEEIWEHSTDMVNSPTHYNSGDIECIDAIRAMLTKDEYVGYLRGNSLKYRWRFRYKNSPIEDLEKADWYEKRLKDFILENRDVLG